mmetsp:Transcript_78412/g.155341  ORF Transcript_78412/g.155341 Transcript_78412/m.155341 type:complete len:366 (-) Transcript_78412:179-1276(-)
MTVPEGMLACDSSYRISTVSNISAKGLCVDDTSLRECPDRLLGAWPNTVSETVTTLRLLKPWDPAWGDWETRSQIWDDFSTWVRLNKAKVLVGTEMSCNRQADDQMWAWSLELMKMLGAEHIMGVSIGNEMDTFRDAKGPDAASCSHDLWDWQYWLILQSRVFDLDHSGFRGIKVTIPWTMSVLGAINTSFKEDDRAKVNTLVTKAWEKWGSRWVWSFNLYTMWDQQVWPSSASDCAAKADGAVNIDLIKHILWEIRDRIKQITGNDDDPLWLTEYGWSSPAPRRLAPRLRVCPGFWSLRTFRTAYENFLAWDLTIGDGRKGPDHAFYFTMRDSAEYGEVQHFGLVASCAHNHCKIQHDNFLVLE